MSRSLNPLESRLGSPRTIPLILDFDSQVKIWRQFSRDTTTPLTIIFISGIGILLLLAIFSNKISLGTRWHAEMLNLPLLPLSCTWRHSSHACLAVLVVAQLGRC